MTVLDGIDVSNYQRGLSISRIVADFVIVKASEGIGYEDPSCHAFAKETLDSHKKLGLYHFARPGKENPAKEEARWFLRIFRPYIGKAIPVLDWEAQEISNVSWAKEWLDEVYHQSGVRPWIYMSESVVNAYDWSDVAKEYRLWMALYHNNTPAYHYDMRHAGTLVHVRHWNRITCWQWTSHGRLDGWQGNLDIDRFYGDTAAWEALEKNETLPVRKSDETIADEVIAGKWGSGAERDHRLREAGYDPNVIDAIVREKTRRKSVDELADEVIEGKWGSGIERKQRLEAAGYDYTAVQQRVDEKLATMSKQYYTVRSGDTLTVIARRFGTSVAELVRLNHIPDPDHITIGERLRVH